MVDIWIREQSLFIIILNLWFVLVKDFTAVYLEDTGITEFDPEGVRYQRLYWGHEKFIIISVESSYYF